MSSSPPVSPARAPHPLRFALLIYPFGAVGGYLLVALAYDLSHHGISVEQIATLIAVSFIPNTWKFLWAPVVDVTWTPARWYVCTAVIVAASVLATGLVPVGAASLTVLSVVVFFSNLASTFNAMAADVLSAHLSPIDQKGRFGGWIQAGNLGGSGLGGGGALYLAEHMGHRMWGAGFVAVTILLCPLALVGLPSIVRHQAAGATKRIRQVLSESWSLVRSRAGALAILVLFLPLGTGAASNLFSAIASDWNASADVVALSTGVWSGVLSAIGCLFGGYICDRIERRGSYAWFALIQAACAVAMAVSPHTDQLFAFYTLAYAFASGLCYASFCALTLEVIGGGAAATKYNLLASLSNFPIQYMTLIDGFGHERFGAAGMLYLEAAVAAGGVVLYLTVNWFVKRYVSEASPVADAPPLSR